VGIALADDGVLLYAHGARRKRSPASNEKLLLSAALFDRLGPSYRIATTAAARVLSKGTVHGNLWVLGHGDPAIASGPLYGRALSFGPTSLDQLAIRIHAAGVRRVDGSVMGATGFFAHDWDAPGWQPYVPGEYVSLPTALALNGNIARGKAIRDPEFRVARALTARLTALGIEVTGAPGAGVPPDDLTPVASVEAVPLRTLVGFMNHESSNFFAETLGKLLATKTFGPPGTISGAARALSVWARDHGLHVRERDASGLSYDDRLSPLDIVRLLTFTRSQSWRDAFRRSLPRAGQGTLEDRLAGIKVRAKTGTLFNGASALSGWVWLARAKTWAEFSILSTAMPKSIEDAIVSAMARLGRIPGDARSSSDC
jgi:D-alanyl-D-alanine carboxypeptidase/D-alanyl-D-alanine-endopeptidase (penicillin-binding protein 4)